MSKQSLISHPVGQEDALPPHCLSIEPEGESRHCQRIPAAAVPFSLLLLRHAACSFELEALTGSLPAKARPFAGLCRLAGMVTLSTAANGNSKMWRAGIECLLQTYKTKASFSCLQQICQCQRS